MKHFFLAVSVSMMVCFTVQAQTKPKLKVVNPAAPKVTKPVAKPQMSILKNLEDSFSYALGLNIDKKPYLMNEEQSNTCIQEKIQGSMAKKNELVKSQGITFLAANKKKPSVISLPNGLQYEVLKKGDVNSAKPALQDTVVAHYAGTLINGFKFDNSYDRGEPLTIPVAGVIRGWTEILQMMHIGDKFKVYIPSELGYGERGAGADIPGGAVLIFEMELLGIKPAITK